MSYLPARTRFESAPISSQQQKKQNSKAVLQKFGRIFARTAGSPGRRGLGRFASCFFAGLSAVAVAGLIPQRGLAQQVTYNSFDTPAAAPGQSSQACSPTSAASGVLFCFNSFGASTPPTYILDSYPAALDPKGGAGGQYYALQLTPDTQSQGSSVWYAIPQNVAGGFNLWYAFKINFTGSNGTPGDGMALLIQNALGSAKSLPDPYASTTNSLDTGSGVTAIGAFGGGLAYGGIDNSVALEMDTFPNNFDPWDLGQGYYFDSHMALQSCGIDPTTGSPIQNSPAHYLDQNASPLVPTSCLINLNGAGAIKSVPSGVSLWDSNPHQVVVVYNGPNDSPANYLYVYLDPTFVPGTHTPVAGSTPVFSGPFDINQYIKLSTSSAYVGFTASTGGSTEQHELMGFAFTPHSSSATVSVSGAGNGSGSVTTSPAAISCTLNGGAASTGTCSASFATGSELSFAASPAAGSTFGGWGGACAGQGTNPVCTLPITDVTAVSATFNVTAPPPPPTIAVTLSGNGGGTVTDTATGINCTLAKGNFTGTCSFNYPAGSQLTLTATPAAGSSFTGWGIPCAGSGPSCTFTVDNSYNVSATFQQQNFGSINVCPSGQNSPAPCSQSLTLTFNVPQNTTLGAVQVVTQGAAGLDFALADAGTCNGTITGGNGCTLTVTFTPLAPGLRSGAVTLLDNAGNQVATQAIYGVGQAPLAAFSPSTQLPISTGSFALGHPAGVLVDALGNLFISDAGDAAHNVAPQLLKVTPNGQTTSIGSGWALPQGMAEDGAGNLFVADNNNNQVVEIPAGCTTAACQKIIPNPLSLRSQLGVAVDPAGNLFVGDFLDGQVAKVPADGTAQTLVYNGGAGSNPVDLTTDASGNLYVADFGLKTVAEVPVGCTIASCVKNIGVGWSQPDGVAVDAAGDVFVADEGLHQIVEVPFGCTSAGCQIVLASNVDTVAVKVDSGANVVFDDLANRQILGFARSHPPNPNFAITNVGSVSSAQSVSLQNVGNQPLAGSLALSGLGANFAASGTCNAFNLAPGAACAESFTFAPQTTGYFTGVAAFSDNTLNLAASVTRQQVTLTGIGGINGVATTTAVPNVIGLTQAAAGTALTNSGLSTGSISTASSDVVPAGSVIASNPAAGTQVALSSAVKLLVSSGPGQPPTPNPLSLLNNYFVTGDYASAGVNLRAASPVNGRVTGTINLPAGNAGVPTGADLIDGFLYWTTLESSASPSGANATFLGYAISGQQIGKDQPYIDGTQGTLRVYRANVNPYFQNGPGGTRVGSGPFTISLPGNGTNGVVLTEGASLVVIYRVLSTAFPLKAVVIYDGAAIPASATTQNVQGFYDAAGGGNGSGAVTTLFVDPSGWNNSSATSALGQADHYLAPLNAGVAYGAVILSTPVNNPDNDGILAAWKAGPAGSDFHGGEPGYYDVKTGLWVALPGARPGQRDLFVQLDYMCGAILSDGSCDPSKENLFPSPDAQGNDPLLMVQQAFANSGIALHLQIGNAIAEDTCVDSPGQPCQFPGQSGVVGWKNSLLFSKVWPRNLTSCASGGDCSPRFAYGQKDSYHYVLFGHSLAIPAWNTRYGSLVSISAVANGQTTIKTTDRGTGINKCPSRITIAGIQGAPNLNGVYTSTSCPDSSTIVVTTPTAVTTSWTYPNNTLAEPIIGLTSGTVTSISGYSDLGGADSAVTLGLWETSGQDMSKRANVIAGTLFHELGHTIGLGHGGLYYDSQPAGSYVPTFEANCKPNYQSIMNYLFQLDGIGQGGAIAFSNQALTTLTRSSLASVGSLMASGGAATFPTSTWYVSTAPSSTATAATLHCDGAPLSGEIGYRVSGPIAPITPSWTNGQNITFDGQPYSTLRGFNDLANIDLRQVGATGGQFASLASVLAFGSSITPLNIAPGGSVAVGPGGTVTLGAGGNITLGAGGNVTIPSGGTIAGNGTITFGTGGTITLGGGGSATGAFTAGTNGVVGLPSGGTVTLGGGGTITLGAGGNVTLGGGGTVTLGAGGTITLGGGGTPITIPAGGSYTLPAGGGTITLGGGGTVTLGGGGNVTLGGGGTITLGAGGTVTLGGGGNVTLGAGGTVTLGGGGTVTLGGGGNVTLGGGGTVTLGAGGNVTLGAGGNVTLGGGGTVTLGAGGDISVGSGGNVTLGAGGTVTLGAGGNITLGAGGTVTLGGGGNVTLGGGGTITLGGGGTIVMNLAGNVTLGGGGTITLGGGGTVTIPPGGSYDVPAGGTITLGAGGTVTLGAGGNVTLGAGGNITLGAGGTITLGGGGTVTLGGGGNVTLGAGGNVTLGAGGNVTLGAGGNITLGGGGNVTLGGGGVSTAELDYDSANSIVRPPPAATYTLQGAAVQVNWTAPAFGVVQTYTISRSVNGGPAVVIGSVSGVGGAAPATTFTDTNPATSGTVVYTIATTLVPDAGTGTQRQSPPSPPAVLTVDQTIQLGPLPSSVSISTSTLPVSATALSNGIKNNQLVSFTATGPCSAGPSTLVSGVSSATVTLSGTGTCTITASQAGDSTAVPVVQPAYNAADPVSGTFTILPAGSNLTSQTITFPQLANSQYGNQPVAVSASTTSGLPITFSTSSSKQCSISGSTVTILGAGTCTVTASQAGNNTYSPASVTQSFNIAPAPLTVIAGNITVPYGQSIPSLANDYTITGYVNGETSAVLNNTAPKISTTATSSSAPGTYPITVSTGTLAATNYSFIFVNATLTLASNVPATGTACNGTYSGTFKGNLTVSKGQTCTFYGGGTTGSITGTGGNINLIGATVGSSVTIQSGGTFNFGPNGGTATTIKGNLTVQSLPRSTTVNQVCGSTITGNVVYQSNGAPAVIGAGTPSCALNTIGGSLQVSSNTAAVTMNGDKVAGSIQVQSNSGTTTINGNTVGVSVQDQSNTGATQVFSNIIGNALQCQSNSAITGSGNKAAVKQGQCAKF